MQELQRLNEKLDVLLKKYSAVQTENKRLKATVAQQLESIESLNGKLGNVEEQMTALQIGKSILNEDQRDDMRKKLDNVIGEIDKILTTLND
jgi:ribosome assembly protein YihI (activator of Der GTPase)